MYLGLKTQVEVGETDGLRHESAIHCDGVLSVAKTRLTGFVGSFSDAKLSELENTLKVALQLE